MSTSLRSRFWRSAIRKVFKEQGLSVIDERARSLKNSKVHVPFPKFMRVELFDLDGLPGASISPPREDIGKVVLYLHGGGYVTGSIQASLMLCVPMSRSLNMRVVLPEYRLAPEHPYPAALDDALKAYRWLLAQGYAGSDIVLCGDSAGGGLCLATAMALRDSGEPLPAAVLCMSPWADLSNSGASHERNEDTDVLLNTDMLKLWASYYAGDSRLDVPYISPAFGDYTGLPPILVQADRSEVLLDDAITVTEKAKAAGVDVTLSLWDGLWHVWPALGDLIPESKDAFEEMKRFLAAHRVA